MGCTHSKNSKSKVAKSKEEQPLERSIYQNRVTHFDETKNSTESTSNESVGPPPPPMQYSKNLLNETNEPKVVEEKKVEEKKEVVHVTPKIHPVPVSTKPAKEVAAVVEKNESTPHTAIPPTTSQHKQFVPSMYYPMPTVGEKQKSPEKKKQRKKPAPVVEEIVIEEKKKKDAPREKTVAVGPHLRPQLTPEDLECIRRSVQQRNERRAYMMAHRNETDDTLYELEVRMPEKDYTNRIEATNATAY